jgi:hypothetical protein
MVTRFVTSLPTDNCPQPKETLPAVSTLTLTSIKLVINVQCTEMLVGCGVNKELGEGCGWIDAGRYTCTPRGWRTRGTWRRWRSWERASLLGRSWETHPSR